MILQYMAKHIKEALTNAGEAFANEMNEILSTFSSYAEFSKHFQHPPHDLAASQDENAIDPYEAWKENKRKLTCDVADFLHDLYSGSHDATLDKMPIEDPKEDPTAVDWASTAIPVSFVIRNLRLSGSTVSSTAAENAPPLMPRTLQRMASDPMKVDTVRQADM